MPIYEFVCGECGHEFEKILSFSATTAPACVNCGTDNVARQMGRPAIHFKGSGWYINDSKKAGGKNGKNNPASAAAGEDTAESTKESAPAADSGATSDTATAGDAKETKSPATEKPVGKVKSEAV
ncbi:MAG: zinc ribbon domain-containing protein [Caldilineaceae bacterium]|nr:zinc ribbon domain-containing protein [Caldilineaceae bacterium]HRJ40603.1 zinc ribbon domain-containing protein [Caldilineaceae bacterium]